MVASSENRGKKTLIKLALMVVPVLNILVKKLTFAQKMCILTMYIVSLFNRNI